MAEQAKIQAIQDIKEDLERQHKCFISFVQELDEVMEALVEEQSQEQLKVSRV